MGLNDLEDTYYVSVNPLNDLTMEYRESYQSDLATLKKTLSELEGLNVVSYKLEHRTIEYLDKDQVITVVCPHDIGFLWLESYSKEHCPLYSANVLDIRTYKVKKVQNKFKHNYF